MAAGGQRLRTGPEIDPNVMFAREGSPAAATGRGWTKQFRAAIDEPQRLSDAAVGDARLRWRKISPPPVLCQIRQQKTVAAGQYPHPG